MWFKLASANFSNNNLGKMSTLSTTWPITKRLSGFTETTSTGTSVDKGAAYNATFTLNSGETYKSHSVTMHGNAVTSGVSYSEGTLTVNISAVTGPVVITTAVEGSSSEPDTPPSGGGTIDPTPNSNLMDAKSRLDANTEFTSGNDNTTKWGAFRNAGLTIEGDYVRIDCANCTQGLAGIRMGVPEGVSALATGTTVKIEFDYRHDESYTPSGEYKFYTTTSAISFAYSPEWQHFSKTYTWDGNWDRLQISAGTALQTEAIYYVKNFSITVVS